MPARFLVTAQHVIVVAQRFPFPAAGIPVEDAPGVLGTIRVPREDLVPIALGLDGRGVEHRPDGALAQREVMGMTYVITEPCIDVRDQACVSVCPVACIHFDAEKDRKLYIDPDDCIDCGACEPMCPVRAIYSEFDLPYKWEKYTKIDALWYRDRDAARAMVDASQDAS